MASSFNALQNLGRSLMLPIAVLPIAGLLLRLGQADLLNIPLLAAAGDAIFSNLGFLFAIGVAVGLARNNDGAAGIGGAVCFLVATKGAEILISVPADILASNPLGAELVASQFRLHTIAKLGVPIGIVSGLIAGALYNRFSAVSFPSYLAFFGGRRFIPIASGFAGIGIATAVGLSWDSLDSALNILSQKIASTGNIGLFLYGFLNRLLLVSGLHHILNNVAWFIVGDYHGVTGDLKRFFANDPSAGSFMAGFFPVMMFGLPAACLAMYHTAEREQRPLVGGMLFSMALTAALTGVTEPIEFAFMFLAPALYAIHAVLTGLAMVLMNVFHIKLGFGFSAGAIDYLLNFNKSSNPILLFPIGAIYAALYYFIFRYCILRFDLKTPGRQPRKNSVSAPTAAPPSPANRGQLFIDALGGSANLIAVDACTTRLRLHVADSNAIDEAGLKNLGAHGVLRPNQHSLQVILGPEADNVAQLIKQQLPAATAAQASATIPKPEQPSSSGVERDTAQQFVSALGGATNIKQTQICSSRLVLRVNDMARINETELEALGVRCILRLDAEVLHLIIGADAARIGAALT